MDERRIIFREKEEKGEKIEGGIPVKGNLISIYFMFLL